MPSDDVSDLRDVVDAINRLCDTMKTSSYDDFEECPEAEALETVESVISPVLPETVAQVIDSPHYADPIIHTVTEVIDAVRCVEYNPELVSSDEIVVQKVEVYSAERWSDTTSIVSGPVEDVTSDTTTVQCEPSEMYYTASSEVSLISEDAPDKPPEEAEERKECPMAGHVAAMRERFESMTRANTPCPDLLPAASPSLDVFRNVTPSPDDTLA